MIDVRSPVFTFPFLALVTVVTLFPPFNWGEERLGLGTERERRVMQARLGDMYDRLPIKTYSFLFGNSERDFLRWSWDGQQSVQVPVALHRRLMTAELVLEYLLALVVSFFVAQVATRIRLRRTRGAA